MKFQQGKTGGLTKQEKSIVKRLLLDGLNNQDVQAFVNMGRPATVNFSRISSVKADVNQTPCSLDELKLFTLFKEAFDPKTGLNPFVDERMVRSREAILTAITIFNNPTLSFRAETFAILVITAWTYLAIEYASKHKLPTERQNGDAISLADFLKFPECPFPQGVKDNLIAMIKLRDLVAHRLMGPYQEVWLPLFQACCLNYESQITQLFSSKLSLASNISLSLQMGTFNPEQLVELSKGNLPYEIQSINSEIFDGMTEQQKNDQAFQFSVVYTKIASSRAKAAIQFVSPETEEGQAIHDILIKLKPLPDTHPYKPKDVVRLVAQRSKKPFSINDHTNLWRHYSVRPHAKSENKAITNTEFCIYNPTFNAYVYSEAWVEKLVKFVLMKV